ncbi:MAG: hypothetical protein K2X46_07715, partial [Roseomonas sp.]|nr:hypothetical protein [Roseomonas sp.]
ATTTETTTLPRATVTRPVTTPPTVTRPETPKPAVARPERPHIVRPTAVLPLPPPPAPPVLTPFAGWDAAPMPNRAIEAPPDRFARPPRTTLEPAIIEPYERRRGFTFGREHAPDRTDRLFNEIAPGARLRIPLD